MREEQHKLASKRLKCERCDNSKNSNVKGVARQEEQCEKSGNMRRVVAREDQQCEEQPREEWKCDKQQCIRIVVVRKRQCDKNNNSNPHEAPTTTQESNANNTTT